MIRRTIFWIHLACGVSAGLVILMMSVTGVILTYERQMLDWADHGDYEPPRATAERLPLETLVAAVALAEPGLEPSSVTLAADRGMPAVVGAGRRMSRYVDPYTGEVLGPGATGLREFFDAVTGWHRWFNASGDSRGPWRAITGASNLIFLFLILSGIYLWLPRMYKWAAFRSRLFFSGKALRGQARDFNWHHVFGIWSAVPLAAVVATAVVFSYSWGNDLVYRIFGEEPAWRGPPPGAAAAAPSATRAAGEDGSAAGTATRARSRRAPLPLEALFERAAAQLDDWRHITLTLPREDDRRARFTIDAGNGGQPQHRHTLVLDAATGAVTSWEPFANQTPGRRARSWVRFLHTGEALGIAGQTVAGVVSLTSVIMVWTGLALAYRRLITPLFRRRPGT